MTRYSDLEGTSLVVDSSFTYDEANRLTNLTHSNSSNDVAFYDLAYDAASRITQIVDLDGTHDYSYDERNQLTVADHSDENNADESYDYDANGNRVSSSLHGSGYITDPNNRLVSDGTYNYEYDNQGNLIRQVEIATGQVQELEWDYLNRLIAVVDKDSAGNETQRVEFTYDMFGRRLSKTVDGDATYFVYDRDNVILDFVEDGSDVVIEQRYLHGTRVDQVLAQESGAGEVVWHLADHLGSIRDLVDNNGNSFNHFVYDSFGNVVSESGSVISRFLFTGREWDEEIDLYYYRARYYDATVGRFIGEDPIGFEAGDSNLYRYVENQPINTKDPSGLEGFVISQSRLIAYEDNGNKITFNIQDVIDAYRQNPNVQIKFDNTLAAISFFPFNTGERIRQNPPSMRPILDQRGHIVGRQLGGDGSLNNSFAQNRFINNGLWKGFETRVRNYLDRTNLDPTCSPVLLGYSVGLFYTPRDRFFPLRPGLVTGLATFSDGTIIAGVAPNP